MIQRCVRGDDSGNAALFAGRDDLLEIGEQEIGSDLDQDRFGTGLILLLNGTRQSIERPGSLQTTEVRCVRGTDVEHNVIGEFTQEPEREKIIIRRFFNRSYLRLSDIDAYWNSGPATALSQPTQPGRNDFRAVVVKTESIDQRFLLRISETPRLRVSGLSFRRNRADFGETEAECCPGRQCHTILIETSGQAD